MKKTVLLVLAITSNHLSAQRFDITADIGQIRYHESSSTLAPTWRKHIWFGLKNPNKSPNCYQYNGEFAISIPDGNDSAVSMLLAAKMANKKVIVTIDDSIKFPSGNYCKMEYFTIK